MKIVKRSHQQDRCVKFLVEPSRSVGLGDPPRVVKNARLTRLQAPHTTVVFGFACLSSFAGRELYKIPHR